MKRKNDRLTLIRGSRITLAVLVVLITLFAFVRIRYEGRPPVKLAANNCDPDLWKHVNARERLHIVEACTVVDGRVASLRRAVDGDLHIGLDPDFTPVLNPINLVHAHGELVVEVICEHTPAHESNRASCGDFRSQLTVPTVGARIRVTGAYVTDRDNGWNEIHPVTRIEILP